MKRIVPLVLIVLAATAFWFRDRWLPQPPGTDSYLGYVETQSVLIGAPQAGRIVARAAEKGGQVKKGDVVFSLDPAVPLAALDQANAQATAAQDQLDDLLSGKRPPEIDVIRAQKAQAEAALALAQKDLARAASLAATGTAAQQKVDQAQSQVAQYQAQVAQFTASEQVALLPGRDAQIAAARANVSAMQAAVAQAKQKLADLSPLAPADAAVDDTYFDPGEWVSAGQPVVSLLVSGSTTIRFFVPEAALAKAQPGTVVTFSCDGCTAGLTATITRTEATPEYTPPVIYSQGARAKLVYMVEAKPVAAPELRPGLPVEVEPLP